MKINQNRTYMLQYGTFAMLFIFAMEHRILKLQNRFIFTYLFLWFTEHQKKKKKESLFITNWNPKMAWTVFFLHCRFNELFLKLSSGSLAYFSFVNCSNSNCCFQILPLIFKWFYIWIYIWILYCLPLQNCFVFNHSWKFCLFFLGLRTFVLLTHDLWCWLNFLMLGSWCVFIYGKVKKCPNQHLLKAGQSENRWNLSVNKFQQNFHPLIIHAVHKNSHLKQNENLSPRLESIDFSVSLLFLSVTIYINPL